MANKQINEFATATKPFADTDIVHAKQGVSDKKMSIGDIAGEVASRGNFYIDSGTINVHTLSPTGKSVAPSEYFDGYEVTYKPAITNTAAVTVNVNAIGARSVYNHGATVAAGDLVAGEDVTLIYNNSSNRFDVKLGSSRYVDTNSSQDINGVKTFLQDVEVPAIVSNTGDISSSAINASSATYWLRDGAGDPKGSISWVNSSSDIYIDRYNDIIPVIEGSLRLGATSLTWNGSLVWTQGNDGDGSGLDADVLDGLQATQFMRSDTNSISGGTIEVNSGSLYSDAPNATANSHYWLRDDLNVIQGVVFWNRADDTIRLRRYDVTGTIKEGELKLSGTDVTFDNQIMWHSGNDGTTSGLDADVLDGKQLQSAGDNYDVVTYTGADGETIVGSSVAFFNTASANTKSITLSTNGSTTDLFIQGSKVSTGESTTHLRGTTDFVNLYQDATASSLQLHAVVSDDTGSGSFAQNSITIPAGVSKARFTAAVKFSLSSTNQINIVDSGFDLERDGAVDFNLVAGDLSISNTTPGLSIKVVGALTTPYVQVSPGEVFKVRVYQNNDKGLDGTQEFAMFAADFMR